MSEVNLQFTVNAFSSTYTLNSTDLTLTPSGTDLTVYAGFAAFPPNGVSGNSQVTFNNAGLFSGSNNFTYDISSDTVKMTNANIVGLTKISNVSNLYIPGGTSGQYLKTDGLGNISFSTVPAGGGVNQVQYNLNGNFAGMTGVTYSSGILTLGSTSNVRLMGGTNGYVLQTDGTGNLTWTAQTGGGGGNGSPGGANSQVQYNKAGTFGGTGNYTFNDVTNTIQVSNATITSNLSVSNLTVSSSASVTGNISAGAVKTNSLLYANGIAYTFITNPGGSNTYVQFNDANSFGGNANFTYNKISNTLTVTNIVANGAGLTNLTGANVTGIVANANYSAYSNIVIGSNQPNITQVGNLVTLGVQGNLAAGNINTVNTANVGNLIVVSNANINGSANITGNVIANNFTSNTANVALITMTEGLEKVTSNTSASTGTVTFDVNTQSILYKSTAATANFTLNIIGNSTVTLNNTMAVNQSLTCTFINTVTTNGYIANIFQIDGSTISVLWPSGAPTYTTLTGSAKDVYSFNIIKTAANTYIVMGSTGRFS